MEFILSSKMKCPKSWFFKTNRLILGWAESGEAILNDTVYNGNHFSSLIACYLVCFFRLMSKYFPGKDCSPSSL